MRGPEFAKVLATLQPDPPITVAYERRHRQGSPHKRTKYSSQREHMVGWMSEAGGPGAYGRTSRNRDARATYNSLRCAPALIWMAEALGEDPAIVRAAVAAADAAGPDFGSQCGAIRTVVPWTRIEEIAAMRQGAGSSLKGQLRTIFKRGRS